MLTLHCLWQRKQVASISKNSGMEENWKKNLATDSYGNPVRSISNLRLIFTLDENLSQIRYDPSVRTMCVSAPCSAMSTVTKLMKSRQERYKTTWKDIQNTPDTEQGV